MICVVEFGAARGLGLAEEHPRRVYCVLKMCCHCFPGLRQEECLRHVFCVLNVMSLLSRPMTRKICETCVLFGECNVIAFQAYDQKNIRRRVYDALNVLMAMNIISKEKKEIRWIGLPTNSAQECTNLELERQRRAERIKQKTQQLQELILQVTLSLSCFSPLPFLPLSCNVSLAQVPAPLSFTNYLSCECKIDLSFSGVLMDFLEPFCILYHF